MKKLVTWIFAISVSIGLLWLSAYLGATKQWILSETYNTRDITSEWVATRDDVEAAEEYMFIVQRKRQYKITQAILNYGRYMNSFHYKVPILPSYDAASKSEMKMIVKYYLSNYENPYNDKSEVENVEDLVQSALDAGEKVEREFHERYVKDYIEERKLFEMVINEFSEE
jgi:hypothetical protein